ncbi:MAG: hypothetical protein A2928_02635 [Candidatus Taylorbacteria bacterium RIFCSPLOWO2_01_FULL_45_15b]|uniref:Homing endonuclease LAGLIDADG domain-containing protein n=1 Tax=Candidatus Taylorbacteria bacterium RIFCSPLOWO2_01_FULL_45_15b TaxID=1802319 RepID=A0A1G2NF37_9BACT|nr:MAG: hypothetical protein A2928_02635 [Candidatus Taylorbacteria bacterium RIFCSPLOWO2_01_FULL_45_15b]
MKRIPWEVGENKFTDAYVAGFFDGDGSLVAILEKQSSKYSRTYRPRLRINFTQHIRHSAMLDRLCDYLGAGHVRLYSSHEMAELVIQDRVDILRVLNKMLPHLILKKNQVILAIEVLLLIGENVRTNRISDINYFKILECVKKIRNLNSKSGGKKDFISLNPVTTSRLTRESSQRSRDLSVS